LTAGRGRFFANGLRANLSEMPAPATVALLVAAAFCAGLVDAIAGGGGLVSLPALLAAGLPPHVALGTNKGQAVFGATASAISFWRRGMIDRARALGRAAQAAALAGIALVLGAYDGFFGPGTGSMLVVAFSVVFGDALTRASGNAKIVNLASNVAAMLLFAHRGVVLWSVALPMAAANALGATTGAHLAVRKGDRLVRAVVLVVVAAVVVKLATDLARAS
jgi:uncharacterized membrane protein YfcA